MKNRPERKKKPPHPEGASDKKDRLKPVSLYPLKFDEAIAALMRGPKRKSGA
jgi:hypothetical protein